MDGAGSEPVEILVVDDREANRVALRAVLDSPEYRLVEAASGSEALRQLLRREFAVLLIDVVMPEMSGLELAALIRGRPQTEAVPILFLTAEASALDRVHAAYALGAVDYLIKPLVPAMVRAKVSVFVELYRQRKRVERQAEMLLESVRQKTELELLQLRLAAAHRFRNLADAIPHIIFTARADGTVDYFNQRWFEYTGISIAEAGGQWIGAVHAEDVADTLAAWERARTGGCEAEFECRLCGAGGQVRRFLGRVVPERGASGTARGWFGTFTDIDEQRRLYDRAVQAVRLRDDFLSIASHELRTPLAALRLHIESLTRRLRRPAGEADLVERVSGKLDLAVRQVDRLTRLVDDLLDVSRMTEGRLSIELAEVELAALVRDVVSRLEGEATRVGCRVTLDANTPVRGRWDPLRVEQIVINLLANALKFGAGRPVEIRVEADAEAARLVVRDHGIGIAAEARERIFRRFERAVADSSYHGLGLGLYIVDRIVTAHGGSISVASEPGQGAEFTVVLPLAASEASDASAGGC